MLAKIQDAVDSVRLVLKSLSWPQVVPGSFTVSLSGVQAVSTLNFQR